MAIDKEKLQQDFRTRYNTEPRLFRAPGRVNLIGEHTDYNDGFVLPVAIDRETIVAARPREDTLVRVFSQDFAEAAEFNLSAPGQPQRGSWLDYVEGVARMLQMGGAELRGADLLIDSDVPLGAGLSSSAALEVSTGLAFTSISEVAIDRIQLALACQQAEHQYVGTKSGIMDQFIAALGQRDHVLLIDCRALTTTQLPLDSSRAVLAICDTKVKHELASSEYNARRAECERGVEILRRVLPDIKALRDVSPAEFQKHEDLLPEPIKRRCRHVVMEDERTLRAAEALEADELEEMGRLMYLSHKSLRDDYEVSCAELDTMVEIAAQIKGVIGARMTGGGFGGCTVNLLLPEALDEFRERIAREYKSATNLDAAVYVAQASDGASEIK